MACGAAASSLQLLVPLSSAVIINQALPTGDFALLGWIAATLAVAMLVSAWARYGEIASTLVLRERLSIELQRDLFDHVQHLPIAFFKNHGSGYLMSRIAGDADTAIEFPTGLTSLGRSFVWLGAAFVLVPVLHPVIGLVVMAVIPLYVAILVTFKQRIKDQFADVQERTAATSRELHEALTGLAETKVYGHEKRRGRSFVESLAAKARSRIRGRLLMALSGHSTQLVLLGVSLFILVFGGFEVIRGNFTLGELVALNALTGYLLTPVSQLVSQAFQMHRSLAAIERLEAILDQSTEATRSRGLVPSRQARGRLTFSDVAFSYRPGEPVISNVNLVVEPGQTILFQGPSGVGKSSLMSLVPRLYEPSSGSISLDGTPLTKLDLRWLRQQIAFVSQDTFLFSTSVRENLRVGRPDASNEAVRDAAQQANALEFIDAMPDGFDTLVGERGCRLSGGQRQRIAIARALLRGATILILDEATSAVDRQTESSVYEALERLMKGRTTLVVAHHVEAFEGRIDRIIDVVDGRIHERPTPIALAS